jgi:hypothetical protein
MRVVVPFRIRRTLLFSWQQALQSRSGPISFLFRFEGIEDGVQDKSVWMLSPIGTSSHWSDKRAMQARRYPYGNPLRAVATNRTYTTSEKELAATNGIRLLHHTDLPELEQMLKVKP